MKKSEQKELKKLIEKCEERHEELIKVIEQLRSLLGNNTYCHERNVFSDGWCILPPNHPERGHIDNRGQLFVIVTPTGFK